MPANVQFIDKSKLTEKKENMTYDYLMKEGHKPQKLNNNQYRK